MNYRISSLIPMILVISSCGRTQDKADVSKQINNTKGDRHVKIAGTNVYIIPPEKFLMTATAEGMFDPLSGARITVTQREHPFDSQSNNTEQSDAYIDQHRVRVNQYEGYYSSVRKDGEFLRERLTFGNRNVTVTLLGEVPPNDTVLVNKVRAAMHSVVLLDEKLSDPSDDAIFKIETKNTKLKFARLINGMLIYTESGNMFSASSFSFIVGFTYGMSGTPDKQETILQQYLREELYYKNVEIKESKPITIDGMSGYEITAKGTHNVSNNQEVVYLVALFSKDGAYTILGTASEQFEDNQAMFRQVAQTFHLKKKTQE